MHTDEATTRLDPATLAVLANRMNAAVREMTNTLLRTGRSTVMAVARDFSCSIVTADNQLLAAPEGLPIHVFGSHLQTAAMSELHPDLAEGDAFLDNDPYVGNTHHADYTILVPVFVEGEHVFTACAKAHQADAGNSIPSTYHPLAKDIYEEGALSFPMVQVQRGFADIPDVIRTCRRRIRVPDQWYGDYLAMLGAARIGERYLNDLVAQYGMPAIRQFVTEWLDYSERRMARAIGTLPAGHLTAHGAHDAFGPLTDGVPIGVVVGIDPEDALIHVDLTDNIDCVPAGINLSRACAANSAVAGVLNVLQEDIPINSGAFRRIRVDLRENCVVGIAQHPTCTSLATTNIADRLINIVQHAFAQLGDGYGLAQGGSALSAGFAVIAGDVAGEPFINQLVVGTNGGPASPKADGWLTYNAPCGAGLIYRDSVELDELRYPIRYEQLRVEADTGGAGLHRGAPATVVEYGPVDQSIQVSYGFDFHERPALGAHGGLSGSLGAAYKVDADSELAPTDNIAQIELRPGERILGRHAGGGGYGNPMERDPTLVLDDYLEGYVSRAAAHEHYGVVLTEPGANVDAQVDWDETWKRRARR